MPRIKWRRGLYAITDTSRFNTNELFQACKQALHGACVMLQYRDKSGDADKRRTEAVLLREMCHTNNAFLIIDNDVQLCLDSDADGVHLGPEDISVHKARNILGPGKIIGASCHQSFEKAKQAVRDTANYVSFGAFYPSRTRADAAVLDHAILNQISELPIPVVAIGGINLERAKKLASQGVDHVAVISDLWNAEDIQAHAEAYQSIFSGVSNIYDRGLN